MSNGKNNQHTHTQIKIPILIIDLTTDFWANDQKPKVTKYKSKGHSTKLQINESQQMTKKKKNDLVLSYSG